MNSEKVFNLIYKDVPPNPTIEFAESMVKKAEGATKVISTGGGSTIDVGKYVSFKLNIPHRAIPTTAGTGSEVTKFAVFIVNGKKWSMEDDRLIPQEYELNPELITSLPAEQTASTGLDALAHAIESWWSPNATEVSRIYARRAINLILNSLYDSYRNPSNEMLRMNMLEAANKAGRAINITKTSICHAISYPLTTKYNIPHGIACSMTLPIFMKYFGMHNQTIRRVERLIYSLGVKKIKVDNIIEEALLSDRSQNTPTPITKEILTKLL
jgi:alcohol dehydrogenase class IV